MIFQKLVETENSITIIHNDSKREFFEDNDKFQFVIEVKLIEQKLVENTGIARLFGSIALVRKKLENEGAYRK